MFSIEAIPCPKSLPLQARLGLLFPFLPFFFPPVLSSAWMGLAFSHPGLPLFWIRSQLGHTGLTGPVWGFAGVVSLLGPQNCSQALTRPSLVSPPFFPSLSRWKPGKQQICVHGNLPGAQSQDENLIGKKRFSLPWLSLASPPHFFSRPPSHFSNSVLRSLFFVYSTANFEAAYP